ncbi:MAG: UDP-N-acetylmuramoyl-L-alanyl-D-glutamate--2,6-diaminopimelate ligase [Bacteroidales bacterium]|jgi:UDP-N-acetylmuramoyl-L-alanyl-D-glutamate--2,6-diaminopimelate ligase|nr:UDP-N-acetylmuramoyl-L-alanyl-D-glutamate--2,6-diaminopimelate ligase [Bacteroidales bacterium]
MIDLESILKGIEVVSSTNRERNAVIESIEFDSRKAGPESLFIAVKGTKTDGHDFIGDAIASGAKAVICESIPIDPDDEIIWIQTACSAKALGIASSNFYGNPSAVLKLVGVTGTNGKTTIATLLYNTFSRLGYKCGLFSTVCNYICSRELPATHTTPDPIVLNRLMAEMVSEGCDYAFMEVSSHAIDQHRIDGLKFTGGIFTNLTHDHLDYHLTFDNYLGAKKKFFDGLPDDAFALFNSDDKNGMVMQQNCKARRSTYSVRGLADFRCRIIEQSFEGMLLRIQGEELSTRFIGDFNASNLLAVFSASELLGAERKEILPVLSNLHPVAGRLEVVESESGIAGIVDYAHTPDALMNVIQTLNRLREGSRQLITVVGAGGDRDRLKRPKMASIAAEGSSKVILTSDNPRTEDPERILDDMEAGISPELRKKVARISNRREAIKTSVMLASRGDVILVAGKGHETYQEVNGVKHHFDDREELRNALLMK